MENILIATLGLEYKVLISALKSFVVDKNIKINKVYVITSHKGKEIIKENLLDNGEFKKFKNAYKLLDIEFDESNILVPKNDKNEYLTGIFTETDNKLFLRECFKITKKFIKTNNIISFLVTGGMKGMSSCLSLTAQLFGREQDVIYTLSLVDKLTKEQINKLPKYLQKELINEKEHFSLTKMPYVKLSSNLSMKALLNLSVDELVNNTNEFQNEKVIIDVKKRLISIGVESCKLPLSLFSLYLYFVNKKKQCKCKKKSCELCCDCYLNKLDDASIFVKDLAKIYDIYKDSDYKMSSSGIKEISNENFNSYKSKIKQIFLKNFDLQTVNQICIESVGPKVGKKFGIKLPKELFVIVNSDD